MEAAAKDFKCKPTYVLFVTNFLCAQGQGNPIKISDHLPKQLTRFVRAVLEYFRTRTALLNNNFRLYSVT